MPASCAGLRLDQALARLLPDFSRSRLKDWIDAGRVQVDRRRPKPRDLVMGGERVVVEVEHVAVETVAAQPIDLDIVHADASLLVINKRPLPR